MKTKIEFVPVADSFVGIRITENQMYFHYPETFNFINNNERSIREQILKVLKTFMLTKKSNSTDTLNSKFNENIEYPLLSYLWILQDYLSYHGYVNRETNLVANGKGKINWKRTIKQAPYVSGNDFIYPNLITEEKKNNDVLLTDVYKYCVVQAIKVVGWLFNISVDSYLKTFRYPFEAKLFTNAVKKELGHTFEDIKRIRLSHMLNILTGLDDSIITSKDFLYGVDKYDVIFEKMLFSLFSNIENIKDYYPSAEWELVTDKLTKKSSNLRPDIILINHSERKAYILDAKYYRFGTTFNRADLPDSSSIQKQVTYGEYIKNLKLANYKVYNAFLMPYNRFQENQYGFKNVIEFVGKAKTQWSSSDVNNEIIGLLIDMNFVIDNWIKYNAVEAEELCKIIEEHTNNI